jgi:hypothetical protein
LSNPTGNGGVPGCGADGSAGPDGSPRAGASPDLYVAQPAPLAFAVAGSSPNSTGVVTITSANPAGATITATAYGTGSVTLGQYLSAPEPGLDGDGWFDIRFAPGSQFSLLQVVACYPAGPETFEWFDPDQGAGWTPVSAQHQDTGQASCTDIAVVSGVGSPRIDDLDGTIFGAEPQPTTALPESPLTAGLPIAGGLVVAAAVFARRRRTSRRSATGNRASR